MATATFTKDPDATLDFSVDWSSWLADAETIDSLDVSATGVDVESSSNSNGVTTAWVSGGTVNEQATIRFRVTTSAGRIDDRTITLHIRHR